MLIKLTPVLCNWGRHFLVIHEHKDCGGGLKATPPWNFEKWTPSPLKICPTEIIWEKIQNLGEKGKILKIFDKHLNFFQMLRLILEISAIITNQWKNFENFYDPPLKIFMKGTPSPAHHNFWLCSCLFLVPSCNCWLIPSYDPIMIMQYEDDNRVDRFHRLLPISQSLTRKQKKLDRFIFINKNVSLLAKR